eukprot:TRINITY_DN2757_c0_g1_i1.p1 TRINITY_DN2757_c0_g1~~TRINITY_DN2757_c0_g1_i1.p1  ORF type:complete len:184 (+),score=28.04 TRINITY_DN2757_c0_g1_i1:46-597(+)
MKVEGSTERNEVNIRSLKKLLKKTLSQFKTLSKRSDVCQHRGGCLIHAIFGFLRSFALVFGIKSLIALLSFILNPKGKKLLKVLFNSENIRFGLFPAVFTVLSKLCLCGARNYTGQDKGIFSFLSGFTAGCVSLSLLKSGRGFWAVYILCRSFVPLPLTALKWIGHCIQQSLRKRNHSKEHDL